MTQLIAYIFRHMLITLLAVAAALAAIALLSQSLGALDLIVDQRQSADIFLKVTLLALPQLVALVLPIATFVGVLIALNRLHNDHELVIAQSAGLSRWSLSQPALRLGVYAALAILFANLWVQPFSTRYMRTLLFSAKTDLASILVKEGSFSHPATGLTVYASERGSAGTLKNILLHDQNQEGSPVTYIADSGQIVARDEGPALIMQQGSRQTLSEDGRYGFLSFDEYTFDLQGYLKSSDEFFLKLSDRFLHELLFPDMTQRWEIDNHRKLWAEAHYRLSSPLYAIAFALIAAVAILGGRFTRLGYGKRIAGAAGIALLTRILGFGAQSAGVDTPMVNAVQYVVPITAILICMYILTKSSKQARALNRLLRQRARQNNTPTPGGAHAV